MRMMLSFFCKYILNIVMTADKKLRYKKDFLWLVFDEVKTGGKIVAISHNSFTQEYFLMQGYRLNDVLKKHTVCFINLHQNAPVVPI
jgi:hypothetical protein